MEKKNSKKLIIRCLDGEAVSFAAIAAKTLTARLIACIVAGLVLTGCAASGVTGETEEKDAGALSNAGHIVACDEEAHSSSEDFADNTSEANEDVRVDDSAALAETEEPMDQDNLNVTEEVVVPSVDDENAFRDEETSEAPQDSEETAQPEPRPLSAEDIGVDFEGEVIDLAEPFRLYSPMWTTTVDSYYAIASDAVFTVTNNGNDESSYIRINIVEYIRSAESFMMDVVHDGEFVCMDMLGEYWNNDDGLWLCDRQTVGVSAGEGLYWEGPSSVCEFSEIVKLYPGESVTFHLPERDRDTVYLVVVRYLDRTENYGLPCRSFYVTADDIRNPLRTEATNVPEQEDNRGDEFDIPEYSDPVTEQITRSEEDVYRFISDFVANYKNTKSYRELEGEGIEYLEDCLNLLRTDPASDESVAGYMAKYQSGFYDDEMFNYMLECWIEFGGSFGEGCIIYVQ